MSWAYSLPLGSSNAKRQEGSPTGLPSRSSVIRAPLASSRHLSDLARLPFLVIPAKAGIQGFRPVCPPVAPPLPIATSCGPEPGQMPWTHSLPLSSSSLAPRARIVGFSPEPGQMPWTHSLPLSNSSLALRARIVGFSPEPGQMPWTHMLPLNDTCPATRPETWALVRRPEEGRRSKRHA